MEPRPGRLALDSAELIERQDDLELLRSALDAACKGNGSLALLIGEPGIGKTRLAAELAAVASTRRIGVLWGSCAEEGGAPAYWPWIQILRRYVRSRESATIASEIEPYAAQIVQLMPELRRWLPAPPDLPVLDSVEARFRLFDGIVGYLRASAETEPLVLILDDLHLADLPSVLLLRFLARELREMRILVVGTYRDTDLDARQPLTGLLAGLPGDPPHHRLHLHGISMAGVTQLLRSALQQDLDAENLALAQALHVETDGNPFYAQEVLRHLAESGRLVHKAGRWQSDSSLATSLGTPESVRDVIDRRLAVLSPSSMRVLAAASVLGRHFQLAVLSRIPELALEPLLEALDEALSARIIVQGSHAPGQFRFNHALVRGTLYEGLSLAPRVHLHRQIAETLEDFYRPNLDAHVAELAHHFLQAAPGGDVAKAIDYAQRAGDQARVIFAYEESARYYQQALQVLDLDGQPQDLRRCELLLALGEVQNPVGVIGQARESFTQAAIIARGLPANAEDAPAGRLLARAALGFGAALFESGRVDDAAVALLNEALMALGEADSTLRARILGRLAHALCYDADPGHRDALAQESIDVARRPGEPATLADALYASHSATWGADNARQRLEMATEILEIGRRLGDAGRLRAGCALRHCDLLELGECEAANAELNALGELPRVRLAHDSWYILVLRTMKALLAGRFEESEQLAAAALAAGQKGQIPDASQAFAVHLVALRREQGRSHELLPAIEKLAAGHPTIPAWRAVLTLALCEGQRLLDARIQFDRLAAENFADIARDGNWLVCLTQLAEVCCVLEDRRRAAQLYDLLLPHARNTIVVGVAAACAGSPSRHLGLLAALLGRWEAAARHFADALTMHERLRSDPLLARTRIEYAATLLARGRPIDTQRAFRLAEAGLEGARGLGMQALSSRAERLLREHAAGRQRLPTPQALDAVHLSADPPLGGSAPTAREIEVLQLLAQGRTNREIAAELAMSVRTAENHLHRLYSKIGARGRADATVYALRHNLLG